MKTKLLQIFIGEIPVRVEVTLKVILSSKYRN